MTNLVISVEGIDGSGKTTLINNLRNDIYFDLIVKNWRDTINGKKIWYLLNSTKGKEKEDFTPWSYILLFITAFNELNNKVIRQNIEKKSVIIDRYIDSTLVYQGLLENIEVNNILRVANDVDLIFPNVTFILDVEPLKAQERIKKRKIEIEQNKNWNDLNLNFQKKIRKNYLELKNFFPERICVIDANKDEKEVAKEVKETIKRIIYPEKILPKFVRAVIYNKSGELLVVKDNKWGWNLPGGRIEPNETPEKAIKREVFEETNLTLKNHKQLGVERTFFANLGKDNDVWEGHFFKSNEYSGEVKIKEIGKILDVKFVNINFFSNFLPYHYLKWIK